MTYNPPNTESPYITTTRVFSEDESQLRYNLNESYTQIATALNIREVSVYTTQEILNGQIFIDPTDPQNFISVFRKIYYFGAIATGATLNIAHGLSGFTQFTHIYGTCITDVVDYRPIPYTSTAAVNAQISIRIVGNNIEIINGAGSGNITSGIVILEYLKN